MIIVNIKGGLGNQMFQHAIGRKLSEKFDANLRYDLTKYKCESNDIPVDKKSSPDDIYFHLNKFSLQYNQCSKSELNSVIRFGSYGRQIGDILVSKVRGRLNNLVKNYSLAGRSLNYYRERQEDSRKYNPAVLNAGPDVYLDGYWESYKYFSDIRNKLEDDFALGRDLTSESQEIARRIKETNSVGIHIRRGDFVHFNTELPISYFDHAIDIFDHRDFTFFVFSVDMQWVISNISIESPTVYVDHHHPEQGNRTPEAVEYFQLLKLCDHTIISNSTFSWWAAWLNQDSDSKVVCPCVWRPSSSENEPTHVQDLDIIPKHWNVVNWK